MNYNYSNNIITQRWNDKCKTLLYETKEQLKKLEDIDVKAYQLKRLKKDKDYPKKGDVFQLKTCNDIILYGVVINNHINNINGNDLLVIVIFKQNFPIDNIQNISIGINDILIFPEIVGSEYWKKGFFSTIKNVSEIKIKDYGFYSITRMQFFDEYGNVLENKPELLGVFSVATISGIAFEITEELIINGCIEI